MKGLLPCLQSITRSVPLKRYRGLTAAVDAMSWLHKGVFACDVKSLAHSQRNESDKCGSAELRCVRYAMDKTKLLREFGIEVLLVIDGNALPSKKDENAQRREDRDEAFEKALAAEKAGDSRAARRFYAQSCSVTYEIRYELIQACKQAKIAFIVAPYEADAQMARLAHSGVVDLVVTEDSDTLAYGCPRVLFKIDFDACQGQEIQLMRDLGENEALSFKNWTHDMFVFMCILSGCDYCKGVPGIGIKLAHKIVRVHRSPSKIFSALKAAGRLPLGFQDEFWVAFRTFRHQRVFCPSKQQMEPLFPIPGTKHDPMRVWPFLGEYVEPDIAAKIADGTFHPEKKIVWEKTLKDGINHNQCGLLPDIQIHHRPPSCQQRRKEAGRRQENIWRALVFGNDKSLYNVSQGEDKLDRPSTVKQFSSKDDMFRFFSKSSDENACKNRESIESMGTRPPLKEIYVDENPNQYCKPKCHALPPQPGHKDLPIHFHEYKSYLVGNKFKPITRLRSKRGNNGTNSTEVVQRIWERSYASSAQENCIDDDRHSEKSGGLAIFSRANNPITSASLQSYSSGRGHRSGQGHTQYQDFHPQDLSREATYYKQHHRTSDSSYYRNEPSCTSFSNRDLFASTTCGESRNKHDDVHHQDCQSYQCGLTTVSEALDSQLYQKQRHRDYYHSHHNDTTVFPSELESDCYVFEDSSRSIHPRETTNHADDNGSLGAFQVFHTQKKPRRRYHLDCAESEHENHLYNDAHDATFDLKEELTNLPDAGQVERDEKIYDDGLLIAFEEMHQL